VGRGGFTDEFVQFGIGHDGRPLEWRDGTCEN
jgi:hypothetical protein